jgi:hypothetical protein
MRSVAIGIYVAIFIAFLRKVVRKAFRQVKRKPPAKFTSMKPLNSGYVIMVQVTWDEGLNSPSRVSTMIFHYLPTWMNYEEAQTVADMLNNPSSRIFTEANINTLISGLIYRCTHVHFTVEKAMLASLIDCELPTTLCSAVKMCRCDVESEMDDVINTFQENLPDETDVD